MFCAGSQHEVLSRPGHSFLSLILPVLVVCCSGEAECLHDPEYPLEPLVGSLPTRISKWRPIES